MPFGGIMRCRKWAQTRISSSNKPTQTITSIGLYVNRFASKLEQSAVPYWFVSSAHSGRGFSHAECPSCYPTQTVSKSWMELKHADPSISGNHPLTLHFPLDHLHTCFRHLYDDTLYHASYMCCCRYRRLHQEMPAFFTSCFTRTWPYLHTSNCFTCRFDEFGWHFPTQLDVPPYYLAN